MPDPFTPVGITLERAVEVVACPRCKAPAGEPCKTPGGRLAPCHSPRYELAKQYTYDHNRLEAWNVACRRDVRDGDL